MTGLKPITTSLKSFEADDHTSQTTIIHILVFSATLLGNGFQKQTLLCFWAHIIAGW
jgi:hypothetical protein